MHLDATHLSSFLNKRAVSSGRLMTSSLSLLTIRVGPRYKILFYKMVSSMAYTLLRFVSLMVAYGLPLSRLFVNKYDLVYIFDMEIIQPLTGVCDVKIYYRRDNMPTLASYRRFPHIETTISVRCKYAVLHSQLCRFSYRCTQREHFIEDASRLIKDIYTQGYDPKLLRRSKLYNFQSTFWRTTKVLLCAPTSKRTRRSFWHKLTSEIYYNATRPVALG